MTPEDKAAIEAISGNALGVQKDAGNAQAVAAAAAAAQQAADATTKAAEAKDSPLDKAVDAAAPNKDGVQEPIIYDVPLGDGKTTRKMTPQQIASTFERYGKLNFQHSQMKPIISVIEKMMKDSGKSAEDVSKFMLSAMAAATKNPQMGAAVDGGNKKVDGAADATSTQSVDEFERTLKTWEDENGVTLPPGLRDVYKTNSELTGHVKGLQAQMQELAGKADGTAHAAREAVDGARDTYVTSVKKQIATNLDQTQMRLELPDDKIDDFMAFAADRGYTLEDFIDPELTMKVGQDFKNAMNEPEFKRTAEILKRRLAYTGSVGPGAVGSPEKAPAVAGPGQPDPMLAQLAEEGMKKRIGYNLG